MTDLTSHLRGLLASVALALAILATFGWIGTILWFVASFVGFV
jgi:hypothetical protein